jgi:hypothetical protein
VYFIGGKREASLPHLLHIFIYIKQIVHWQGRKNNTMDHLERRGWVLVVLALNRCLHLIVKLVLDMHALAINGEWENAMIFSISFESINTSDCSVRAF